MLSSLEINKKVSAFASSINKKCKLYRLDTNLVKSIIMKESAGDLFAVRFEPKWKYLVSPDDWASRHRITKETEIVFQSCSFGLMQIMGSVCLELGFDGKLPELFDPEINLEFGCRKLRQLFDKYEFEDMVISSYNQGSPRKTKGGMFQNQSSYVDGVYMYLRELRKLK